MLFMTLIRHDGILQYFKNEQSSFLNSARMLVMSIVENHDFIQSLSLTNSSDVQ